MGRPCRQLWYMAVQDEPCGPWRVYRTRMPEMFTAHRFSVLRSMDEARREVWKRNEEQDRERN